MSWCRAEKEWGIVRVIDRDRTDHSDFDKIVGFPDWCCANAACLSISTRRGVVGGGHEV